MSSLPAGMFQGQLTAERVQIQPTREQTLALFEQGDLVPVYRTLLADLDTPMSVYLKLSQTGQYSFMLESVEGGEQVGRYSFIGVNPKGVITVSDGIVRRTCTARPSPGRWRLAKTR